MLELYVIKNIGMLFVRFVNVVCLQYYTIFDYRGIRYDVISTNTDRGDNRGLYCYSVVDINVKFKASIVHNCFIL